MLVFTRKSKLPGSAKLSFRYILVFFGGQKLRYEMLKILGVHSMFSWISVPAWHPQPLDKVSPLPFQLEIVFKSAIQQHQCRMKCLKNELRLWKRGCRCTKDTKAGFPGTLGQVSKLDSCQHQPHILSNIPTFFKSSETKPQSEYFQRRGQIQLQGLQWWLC